MASAQSLGNAFLVLLFLIWFPPTTISQDSSAIADCTPRLLPLAACASFLQGSVRPPAQPCCDNLRQVYNLEPHCLCLLLNHTTFTSFPINTTLALQLHLLCHLQLHTSACSGSQVSLEAISNSTHGISSNFTVAASPMAPPGGPKHPSMMGLRFGQSNTMKLKTEAGIVVLLPVLLTKILY